MILLDASILVGIINSEVDALACLDVIESNPCAIPAPTLVECNIWCAMHLRAKRSVWLAAELERPDLTIVPFTAAMADLGTRAFGDYGRGSRHPARLNFGDCLVYATAKLLGAPLLFKGNDFSHTDLLLHPASIRTGMT